MSTFTFVSENDKFGSTPAASAPESAAAAAAATAPETQYRKKIRWGEYIPPEQKPALNARSSAAEVPISRLKIGPDQRKTIEAMYHLEGVASFPTPPIVDYIYSLNDADQVQASAVMAQYGLDADSRELIGNRWSHQWSRHSANAKVDTRKILYLCACGYDHHQRNTKYDRSQPHGASGTQERHTGVPFTACLAHAEITLRQNRILRIRGHFEHNQECRTASFDRTPPIPVHPSVFVAALAQLRDGATFNDIRQKNRNLFEARAYADFPADLHSSPYRWLLTQMSVNTIRATQNIAALGEQAVSRTVFELEEIASRISELGGYLDQRVVGLSPEERASVGKGYGQLASLMSKLQRVMDLPPPLTQQPSAAAPSTASNNAPPMPAPPTPAPAPVAPNPRKRKQLLPPSPEKKQRRHQSYGVH